jgi:hypothetical protein
MPNSRWESVDSVLLCGFSKLFIAAVLCLFVKNYKKTNCLEFLARLFGESDLLEKVVSF